MKYIELTRGLKAIVDDADFEELSRYKWYAQRLTYGGGFAAARWKSGKIVYMHCEIMKAPKGLVVDHIYHDTLDNRRSKLRNVTRGQNQHNRKPHGKTSKLKGVAWHPTANKWVSHISCEGTQHYLGLFKTEKEAAVAYKKASKKYHGEFAYNGT